MRNAMAKVGLTRAAELTGKSPSTIHRAMRKGRLSFEMDEHRSRLVDVSELERVFGLVARPDQERNATTALRQDGVQLIEQRAQLDVERMRTAMLEERLRDLATQRDELRDDRNRWRTQAERLLTDQRPTSASSERPAGWWSRLFGV